MRDPVIVSYARTPIGKAYRGAFNDTQIPVLAAHALRAAVARARLEGGEIEDLTIGCALTQGTGGINAARYVVMAAGLPGPTGPSVHIWTFEGTYHEHTDC